MQMISNDKTVRSSRKPGLKILRLIAIHISLKMATIGLVAMTLSIKKTLDLVVDDVVDLSIEK